MAFVLPFEEFGPRPGHGVLAQTLPREFVGWLAETAPEGLRVVDRTAADPGGTQGSPGANATAGTPGTPG